MAKRAWSRAQSSLRGQELRVVANATSRFSLRLPSVEGCVVELAWLDGGDLGRASPIVSWERKRAGSYQPAPKLVFPKPSRLSPNERPM